MSPTPIREEEILQKIDFANRRMADLVSLNGGDFPGAPAFDKHLLAQEFFFHLIGAVELTAQFVNEVSALGLDPDAASTRAVLGKLNLSHPVRGRLAALYANPRKSPMPPDPYCPEGLIYRAYNYRHQVTHRRANPFLYRVGSTPKASFILDPRASPQVPSERSVQDEMAQMLELVREGCQEVVELALQASGGGPV